MDSLTFITDICGALKTIKRTGWVRSNVPLPESDADHMHRCAMCAMLLSQPADTRDDYSSPETQRFHPSNVDQVRLLRMAVTHDVCEALAGDITPHCDAKIVASKHDKEDEAMKEIRSVIGDPLGRELHELWKEYEEQKTVEAVYCKDIDKFEMVVQAYEYEKSHLRPRSEVEKEQHSCDSDGGSEGKNIASKTNIDNGADRKDGVHSEPLRGFFVSTNSTMKTPLFQRLDRELRDRREAMLKTKGWCVTDEERQKA